MGLLDAIEQTIKNTNKKIKAKQGDTFAKGDLFEEFILKMFPAEAFNIIDCTHSKDDLDGRGTESCKNPDYHLRDIKTKKPFWIECKFRSSTFENGTLQWCEYYQLKRYLDVIKKTEEKVYIIIGLGGKPQCPEKIFCIDLEKIPYNKLFRSAYEPCEIEVQFFKSLNHLEKQLP